MATPSEWYRDNFLVSTASSLLQPAAINAAFGSDFMYWTKSLSEELLTKLLSKSLCFGVYELPKSSFEIAGRAGPKQIGLARLITDEVSAAYLTDVYILPEYQGKGLGKWLIQCVDETLNSWPELRRVILLASGGGKLYKDNMGAVLMEHGKNGLEIFHKKGAGWRTDV